MFFLRKKNLLSIILYCILFASVPRFGFTHIICEVVHTIKRHPVFRFYHEKIKIKSRGPKENSALFCLQCYCFLYFYPREGFFFIITSFSLFNTLFFSFSLLELIPTTVTINHSAQFLKKAKQ